MESKRFLANIKRLTNKVSAFLFTRNVVTFLLFLLLALGMWMMHTIGTQRELRDTLPVKYIGIPNNVRIDKELPPNISFAIEDEGKHLWKYQTDDLDTLEVDLSSQFASGAKLEIEYKKILQKELSHLSPTIRIIELTPGYFTSRFTSLNSKEVPVRMPHNIRVAPNHVMCGAVKMSPSFITIYGTPDIIDLIDTLNIQPVNEEFMSTKTINVKIITPPNVDLSENAVDITVPVEECTEKELEIPIELTNVPATLTVQTFPSVAKVRFSVGLSRFNDVDPTAFDLQFDYSKIMNHISSKAPLHLVRKPEGIFNVSVIPSEVDFVIEYGN